MCKTRKIVTYLLAGGFIISLLTSCNNIESLSGKHEEAKEQAITRQLNDWQLENSLVIHEGVSIEDLKIQNKNKLVAKEEVEKEFDKRLKEAMVNFAFEDKKYSFSLKDLGVSYDYDKAIDEAYKKGRNEDQKGNLESIKALKENPESIKLEKTVDEKIMLEKIDGMNKEIKIEVKDAKYVFDRENAKVVAEEGTPGREVDTEKLKADILALDGNGGDVKIEVKELKIADDFKEKAERVKGIIGSAVSNFNAYYYARVNNIEVSTNYLDGCVIGPGEIFSVNEIIGDTTPDKGYTEAIVIVNDEEVPGYGGGVCQTATALYQAALRADMEIVTRFGHTMKMPYAQGGLDATIEYGSADLAFKNPFDFPVLIRGYYQPGQIEFQIWGDTDVKNYDVAIWGEYVRSLSYGTITNYDGSLEKGQQVVKRAGTTGEIYQAFRRNESTGVVQDLGYTQYNPIDQIISVNN